MNILQVRRKVSRISPMGMDHEHSSSLSKPYKPITKLSNN
jgi:hypothetical protein